MANAKHDGVYTLDGSRFLIHKGDSLPEGAVLDGDGDAAPETPEASKDGAAETKAAKSGPSETTDAVSTPSETV